MTSEYLNSVRQWEIEQCSRNYFNKLCKWGWWLFFPKLAFKNWRFRYFLIKNSHLKVFYVVTVISGFHLLTLHNHNRVVTKSYFKNQDSLKSHKWLTSSREKKKKKNVFLLIRVLSTPHSPAPFIMSDTGSVLPSICLTLQEGNWCAYPSEPHGSIYGMDPCL